MKNKYVEYEISREVNVLFPYLKEASRIFDELDHMNHANNLFITKQEYLASLQECAYRMISFVKHLEALKTVEELPS